MDFTSTLPFLLLFGLSACSKSTPDDASPMRVPSLEKAPENQTNVGTPPSRPSAPALTLLYAMEEEHPSVLGKMFKGEFVHSVDMSVKEIRQRLVEGAPLHTSSTTKEKTLASGARWNCDEFVVDHPTTSGTLLVVGEAKRPIFPRAPRPLALTAEMKSRANRALKALGATGTSHFGNVVGIDLDGDGKDEVLLSVEEDTLGNRIMGDGLPSKAGDHQGLLLLPGDGGVPDWTGTISKGAGESDFASYSLDAAPDLDGDGRLEVLLSISHMEGGMGLSVYRYQSGSLVEWFSPGGWGETECSDAPWEDWGTD